MGWDNNNNKPFSTHEIRLELCEIDVERAVESKRRRDWRYDLSQKTIEIRVSGPLNVQISSTYVVQRLVVNHERAIRVFERRVGNQQRVVRLDNRGGNLQSIANFC